ncbi:MAG: putative secreted peptidase, partial [Chloroflexi bacterium]|nr:putative secreted peptidase [Chloroflexota bacterium]
MNVLLRRPGRFLLAYWTITLAMAVALLVPRPGTSLATRTITLLTGQMVTLDKSGMPQPANGLIESSSSSGDAYAIPVKLLRAVGIFFDPKLFDVSYLESRGFGDDQTHTMPVLISFKNRAAALTAFSRQTVEGIHITHVFEYLPVASGYVSRSGPYVPESAAVLNGSGVPATGSANVDATPSGSGAGNADGVTGLYLDDKVSVSPEQPAPLLDSALPIIGADVARAHGLTGKGVRISVIDTGIDESHPDLKGRVVSQKNFSSDNDTVDHFGHGTHVASIAAGTGAASDGKYGGVAPLAQLINAKALSSRGSGTDSGIMQAMEWSADQGAKVINMSLGGGPTDGTDPMSRAVNAISEKKGVLFVIAAGNSGPRVKVSTPAAANQSLAVGAIDKERDLAAFSSRGPRLKDMALKPDIVAPGVRITAARANYGSGSPYATFSGTSMATPMVAGSAALVWQLHPTWTALQVKAAMISAASPIGLQCAVSAFDQGSGVVDLARLVNQSVMVAPGSLSFGTLTGGNGKLSAQIVNLKKDAISLTFNVIACPSSSAADELVDVSPAKLTVPGA